jgi:hypothetical protein
VERKPTPGAKTYLEAPGWSEYQRINRPSKQRIPAYDKTIHAKVYSVSTHVVGREENEPVENPGFNEYSVSTHSKRKEGKEKNYSFSSVESDGAEFSTAPTSPSGTLSTKTGEKMGKLPSFLKIMKGVQ